MQTKDLSNRIDKNIDDTPNDDHVTTTGNATTTNTTTSGPIEPIEPASRTSLAPLQLPSKHTINTTIDESSAIINILAVPYSLELPKKTIDKILNDEDHIPSNQTFDNATRASAVSEARPVSASLPTPIVPQKILNIKRTPVSKDNGGGGGRSAAFRSALRLAAIEGLEAMNDLYDRKVPNMLRKGEFFFYKAFGGQKSLFLISLLFAFCLGILSTGLYLSPNHPGARLSAFGAPTNNATDAEKGAFAALYVAKKMKNV